MRGKMLGALLGAALFTALTGTAHAGYVTQQLHPDIESVHFDALPHENADLRIQVLDGGATVVIEDRANPITPGVEPLDTAPINQPCEIVSTHVARCTNRYGNAYSSVDLDVGPGAARVQDVPGSAHHFRTIVNGGPQADVIDLNHGALYFIFDQGGANTISIGPHIGFDEGSYVHVGPGRSTIDVQNGVFDRVGCLRAAYEQPELGVGAANVLDSVTADPGDQIVDCD